MTQEEIIKELEAINKRWGLYKTEALVQCRVHAKNKDWRPYGVKLTEIAIYKDCIFSINQLLTKIKNS